MEDPQILWDMPDDEDGNVWSILGNGVSLEEVEAVFRDRSSVTLPTRGGGEDLTTIGRAHTGRYIAVIWQLWIGEPRTICPINARVAPPPKGGSYDPPERP